MENLHFFTPDPNCSTNLVARMLQNHYKTTGFDHLGNCNGRLGVQPRKQKYPKTIGFCMISPQCSDPIRPSKQRPEKGAPTQVCPCCPRVGLDLPKRYRNDPRGEPGPKRAECQMLKNVTPEHQKHIKLIIIYCCDLPKAPAPRKT